MDIVSTTRVRHGSFALPWRTFLLGGIALAAYLLLGAAPEHWVYDRAAIAQGELWRLVTGHWVHSDLDHAVWDISALILLGTMFESRLQWRLPLALVIGTLAVDAWLWWGDPALAYYCGLSGILNSLLVVGLVQRWCDLRHPLVWMTALGAALKIGVEIFMGQALVSQTAWPSVPMVHAVGFLSGLVLAGVPGFIGRTRSLWQVGAGQKRHKLKKMQKSRGKDGPGRCPFGRITFGKNG